MSSKIIFLLTLIIAIPSVFALPTGVFHDEYLVLFEGPLVIDNRVEGPTNNIVMANIEGYGKKCLLDETTDRMSCNDITRFYDMHMIFTDPTDEHFFTIQECTKKALLQNSNTDKYEFMIAFQGIENGGRVVSFDFNTDNSLNFNFSFGRRLSMESIRVNANNNISVRCTLKPNGWDDLP